MPADPLPIFTHQQNARPDGLAINSVWSEKLVEHARLSALVGPDPLHIQFDCADDDFVFALTSSWPAAAGTDALRVSTKQTTNTRYADVLNLAENFNRLVRLYALESGNTHMHVLVEARRGVVGVPAWWDGHPCLFAIYAFDTTFSEVGLFSDPMQAFAALEMISTPHRLMLAVGPARPEWAESEDGEAWIDADAQRILALKRVEAQISKDIARLMASTSDISRLMADAEQGGMYMEEALVEGLARVRNAVQKMRGAIMGYQHRRSKKFEPQRPGEPKIEQPSPVKRMRVQNSMNAEMAERGALAKTVRELQGVLKKESNSQSIPLPARQTLRHGLTALTTLEQQFNAKPVVAPATALPVEKPQGMVKTVIQKIAKAVAPQTPAKKVRKRISTKNQLLNFLEELMEDEEPAAAEAARPAARSAYKAPAPGR